MTLNILRTKQWIQALRDRNDSPSIGWLCFQNRFSAFGILCNIYQESLNKGKNGKIFWRRNLASFLGLMFLGHETVPPREIIEWIGLDDSLVEEVIQLNDNGSSFATIADFLEGVVNHEETERYLMNTMQ